MTNKEAIERVTIIMNWGGMTIPVAMRDIEALDMAIKALAYDRDQYNKGYTEGYRRGLKEGKRIAMTTLADSILRKWGGGSDEDES